MLVRCCRVGAMAGARRLGWWIRTSPNPSTMAGEATAQVGREDEQTTASGVMAAVGCTNRRGQGASMLLGWS